MKTVRNTIVFGSILFFINWLLNTIILKILESFNIDSIYDSSMVLYTIIMLGLGTIIFLVAFMITKKIVSMKLQIDYQDAKKMLLSIVVIFLLMNIIKFGALYYNSIQIEEELNQTISEIQELKNDKGYKLLNKSEKNNIDTLYKTYVEGRTQILEIENEKRNIYVISFIFDSVARILCWYVFGLYLYRRQQIV